jgi:hypothetical protein
VGPPEDEVLFQDITYGVEYAKLKNAFTKLQYTCHQAQQDGLEYCWIDTCAIDKRSSAELQEAINSMYRWYQNAEVCYAYLSDVNDTDPNSDEFSKARWFTRGWTLQELLAPKRLVFYTATWKEIGQKIRDDKKKVPKMSALLESLHQITGVDIHVLSGRLLPDSIKCCRAYDMGFWKANLSNRGYGILLDGYIFSQHASNIW